MRKIYRKCLGHSDRKTSVHSPVQQSLIHFDEDHVAYIQNAVVVRPHDIIRNLISSSVQDSNSNFCRVVQKKKEKFFSSWINTDLEGDRLLRCTICLRFLFDHLSTDFGAGM